jgi:hypothetical protein
VTTTERLRRVLIAILSTQTLVCIRLIAFIVKKADMVKKAGGNLAGQPNVMALDPSLPCRLLNQQEPRPVRGQSAICH